MVGDRHTGKVVDGRYELVRHIDEGGMGSVYLGRHIKIGRKAAVKFLHASLADQEDVVKRFYREAQAASTIEHPNIIDIFDVGVSEWGEPYLVMEYLSGENLDSVLQRKQPISLAAACAIMEPALRALFAAHEQGIVHRDIKPENIFIVRQPDIPPTIKLIDFGISKFVEEDTLKLTQTGTLLGTPSYMSPEQARGKGDVDHRADLFSLGVIFYQMLVGELPFRGQSYNDLIFTVLTESYQDPFDVKPQFPVEALPIVERLLQKEPEHRYQSASDVLSALESLSVFNERQAALEALTIDIKDENFATGDLGQEISPKQAMAETVLASISPDSKTVAATIDSESETVVALSKHSSDDEWVMNSGHLPPKKAILKRRSSWPYWIIPVALALSALLFFTRGLWEPFFKDDATEDEGHKSVRTKKRRGVNNSKVLDDPEDEIDTAASSLSRGLSDSTDGIAADPGKINVSKQAAKSANSTLSKSPGVKHGGIEEKDDSSNPDLDGQLSKIGGAQGAGAGAGAPNDDDLHKDTDTIESDSSTDGVDTSPTDGNQSAIVIVDPSTRLSPSDVNRLLAQKSARIEYCYDMARIKTPSLAGVLELRIGIEGNHVRTTVIRNETNATLAGCVIRAITSIKPPANNGELVEIEKTYNFTLTLQKDKE